MANPTHIYVDHRGWKPILEKCHAGVMGISRHRQCSRKAVTTGHIHYGLPSLQDGPSVPLCSQHAKGSNVVEDGHQKMKENYRPNG